MAIVNDNNQAKKRTSKGKQKIEIKKIDKKTSRQVAFTKRRNGLFRKCSKLCADFGCEYAVVTFSEAGKPFVSGYPSPDVVIHRFLNDTRNKNKNVVVEGNLWDTPIDHMGLEELEGFKIALEGLRSDLVSRVDQTTHTTANDTKVIDHGLANASTPKIVNFGFINSNLGPQETEEIIDFGCVGLFSQLIN